MNPTLGALSYGLTFNMELSRQKLLLSAACTVILSGGSLLLNHQRRKRRWWVRPTNPDEKSANEFEPPLKITGQPSAQLECFNRMSRTDFEYILNKISPLITKNNKLRQVIPADQRLAITLRFLATGDSFKSLGSMFKVSNQVVSSIVHEVCRALIQELQDEIQLPTNPVEWQIKAHEFNEKCDFPLCLGVLSVRQLQTVPSSIRSGFEGMFSISVMSITDANYCFTFIDVDCQGSNKDESFFKNSTLQQKIDNGSMYLPVYEVHLPSLRESSPYVFLADETILMSEHIVKPYPATARHPESMERIFNYRLRKALRIADNTFGHLTNVFTVLRKPMLFQPLRTGNVGIACMLLHNFLMKSENSEDIYCPEGSFDSEVEGVLTEGIWRRAQENNTSMVPLTTSSFNLEGKGNAAREKLAQYFISENGKIPGQENAKFE